MSVRLRLAAGAALSLFTLAIVHFDAQQQYPRSSPVIEYKPAAGMCLTAEQRKVNDNYNSLSRPTRPGDVVLAEAAQKAWWDG